MIDFACKQFQIEDVIKCSLSLTKADFKTMVFLAQNSSKWFTTDELAARLDLDLSTVQRAVKKLHEKKIIERLQANLEGGGYVYTYRLRDKRDIRQQIMGIVNNWVSTVEDNLRKW